MSYLAGTQGQLDPAQLDFISKRVERFMRELDIPGLSVAISRDEQLKFAAGLYTIFFVKWFEEAFGCYATDIFSFICKKILGILQ